jgi:sialidase-1
MIFGRALAAVFLACCIVGGAWPARAAGPDFGEPQVVFRSDRFACHKIPAIAGNGQGVLIAAVEQRFGLHRSLDFKTLDLDPDSPRDASEDRLRCGDWGFANVIFRRSTDNGRSWEDVRLLADLRTFAQDPDEIVFAGNQTLIYAPRKNRFVALFVVSRARGPDNSASCVMAQLKPNKKCRTAPAEIDAYSIVSDDLGLTWSKPKRIPRDKRLPPLFRPGPGHGTALKGGRLVAPAYPILMISDDDGDTWRFGADNRQPNLVGSETSLAPLPDGRIWSLMRMANRDRNRLIKEQGWPMWLVSGISEDGGLSYETLEATRRFPIPEVHTSLLLAPLKDGGEAVVLSAPTVRRPAPELSLHRDRRDMMMAVGQGPDRGPFAAAIVHRGPAGYSDLVTLGPGRVGLLYEGVAADDPVMKERSYVRTTLFKAIDLDKVIACARAEPTPSPDAPPPDCFSF